MIPAKDPSINKFFPLILALLSGFSVFYFLYFFDAYGIQKGLSYSGHSHLFRSISFGLLSFLYLLLFEAYLKPELTKRYFGYDITWYLALMLLGCQFIFLLFNFFWNWQEWDLEAYLLILKEYPLMLLLPFTFYWIIRRLLATKQAAESYMTFQSENGKDQLKLKLNDFLYAQSSENYISIFYRSKQKTKEHLIRKPLKVLTKELDNYSEIKRVHRSYLVNMQNVQAVKQSKGKIHLETNGIELPVSKRYEAQFL